ncbi:MAG: PAS domain-containing sensor histidine kinase [Ignavibacterium sp.]|jgi:PAS domain S-box-containing protein|nr:PAS domain-containing sensor histidine kinase [Ignavibacterium sp.]
MKKINEDSFPLKYFLYFLFVAIVIAVSGYIYYQNRKVTIEDELYRHVATIKEMKLTQIEREQSQRKQTIQSYLLLPVVENDLEKLLTGKKNSQIIESISKWSNNLRSDFDFVSVNIFDKNANLLFSTDSTQSLYNNFLKHELTVLLQKENAELSNLYFGDNKSLLQAIITPVRISGKILGYIWTEISFFEYLHPIISYTKQETQDVEYILLKKQSDLGFILKDVKENNQFRIKTIPLNRTDKAELEALLRGKEFFKGAKSKGAEFFASVNNIPSTDWILIAKIDQDSVTQSTRNAAMLVSFISVLLIVLSASITYAIWKRSRLHFLTQTVILRKEKDALNERYTSLTKYANDAILSIDKNGKILEANQKAFDLYGYSKDELIKKEILDLSQDRKKDIEVIFSSINNPDGILFETNHKRKNGTFFPVEISAKLIKQGNEETLLAIIRDNTERKKLELDLILAKDKAEEMDRLKTTFLANMSHELNTPMSGIIGFSELLLSEMDNPNQREMAKIIYKSSKRLNETLNSILDLSKLESNNLQLKCNTFDIVSLLQECKFAFIENANKKGIQFSVTSDKPKILVYSDQSIVHKVLCNIIDNSIKYTEKGEVKVHLSESADHAQISVSDTGIGIPQENLDQIFEPFRQGSEGLNRKFEGMGLGLSITKKFIEVLHGKLKISSTPSIGTKVSIELPKK